MDVKRCANGHYYDADMYSTCPQCSGAAGGAQAEDYGKTEPLTGGGFGGEETGLETMPPTMGDAFETNVGVGGFSPAEDYDQQTERVILDGVPGFSPVTAWLVCIEGSQRGKDYRVKTGNNYIGRDERMDICIRGDKNISRDRHAVIAYDDVEKEFYFAPVLGGSLVRINGKAVIAQTLLKDRDVLTIGTTKLLFVALCDENFSWEDKKNEEEK